MIHSRRSFLLVLLLPGLSSMFSSDASAQSKVGTTVGQFLKIEPSARVAAMGNTGASLFGESSAAVFNPASLGRLDKSDVQFSHLDWLVESDYNYASLAVKVAEVGTFFLQIISLNSGEIEVRTVNQPLGTGERYDVGNFALGTGYGRMITDRVSIGVQVNYWQERIWHSSISGLGLNFGIQYQLTSNGPTLGASVANFGLRSGYDGTDLYVEYDFDSDVFGDNDKLPAGLRTDEYSLPTNFRVGLSWPVQLHDNNRLLIAIDGSNPNDNNQSVRLGAEWQLFNYFYLRGGYRDLFLDKSEGGMTLGGGIDISYAQNYTLHFDYAWADYGRLDVAHRLTIGVKF
jgi:hypothetical protein